MLRRFISPLALILVARLAVLGDVVVLQTGERVEGKIVRQNSEALVIEVAVSSGIVDTRTYTKAEIKEVEKESPDQLEYQKIAGVKPGANSLMPAAYDQAAADLRAFLRSYPESAFKPAVEENLKALLAEKERVEQGELKQNGKWLTPDEVAKNRYQIEAQSVFEQMKQFAQAGNYIGALNAFDTLERDYPGSRAYPQAVPIATQLLRALATELNRKKLVAEREETERKAGVEITSEPKKSQLVAAYEAEQARYKALLDQATAQQIKWPPLIPRSPDSVSALEKLISEEDTRLSGIDVASMQSSLRALDRAEAALASGDLETARTELDAAGKDWPTNDDLKNAGTELKEKETAAASASASPAPEAVEATPTAAPSPVGSSATPAPTPTPVPTATPAATASSTPMKPKPTMAAPEAEERPFYKTVGGAVTILVVTLGVAGAVALIGKVKKPAPPEDPTV